MSVELPAASIPPESVPLQPTRPHVVSIFGYYGGIVAACFLAGGWLYLQNLEAPPPPGIAPGSSFFMGLCAAAALVVTAVSGWRLARGSHRNFVFGTVTFAIFFPLTVLMAEFAARMAVPPWPAIGLHGVTPGPMGAWARASERAGATGVNNWGQRDVPRTLRPPPKIRRIAFIGDSFLEESSTIPVSLRVQQRLEGESVEVLNLGVSASGPEEYYHRLRRIALPLGTQHCVMFIFAGNDFVDAEVSLPSARGIAAVYPRGSMLQSLGLLGINHLLTNRQRPVIQAWLTGGDLHEQEQARHASLARMSDDTMRQALAGAAGLPADRQRRLEQRLGQPAMKEFFQILREPDEGLFRSYYLVAALTAAGSPGKTQWAANSEVAALHWVTLSANLCRELGVDFTLVIIPEAFQVDSRMQKQWAPLADMRHLTKPTRDASRRLAERARAAKIDTLDLHTALPDQAGCYLNLDGHWSDQGVEIVSEVLAKKFVRPAK